MLYRAGNCDQLQTKMRREPKLPPQHFVMVRETLELHSAASARLAHQRLLSPFALAIVKPRLGRAPHMLGDAIRTEDAAAGDRRRTLAVEAGEDIMSGVLAPDDDPGHDWLLSAPLLFAHRLVRHHNEDGREAVPWKKGAPQAEDPA